MTTNQRLIRRKQVVWDPDNRWAQIPCTHADTNRREPEEWGFNFYFSPNKYNRNDREDKQNPLPFIRPK